jgi:hypothetical protein
MMPKQLRRSGKQAAWLRVSRLKVSQMRFAILGKSPILIWLHRHESLLMHKTA